MSDRAAQAIAVRLKWKMADVRHLLGELEADGVHVTFVETTGELCPCGYHYATAEGLCVTCLTERDLLEKKQAIEDEEEQLEARAIRAENALKQERKRMRQTYGANPRKGFDWAKVLAHAAEHPEEWEEAKADIDAAIYAGLI